MHVVDHTNPSSNSVATVPVSIGTTKQELHVVLEACQQESGSLTGWMEAENLDSDLPHFKQLEHLEAERKNWESNELAASHTRLYSILSKCYAFYLKMKSSETSKEVRVRMSEGLEAFIKGRGLRTLAGTHDMNRVVKAVFGEDRRRVSAYSLALRVALDSNVGKTPIAVAKLAAWIAEQGGVEEIRQSKRPMAAVPAAERVEQARSSIKNKPLMTFKPDAKTMPMSAEDADKQLLLIATYRPSGDLEINSVVKNDSALRAALAAHYAANKDAIASKKSTETAAQASAMTIALGAVTI
jgi:hypothetical protein